MNNKLENYLAKVGLIILAIAIVALLISCSSSKKVTEKFADTFSKKVEKETIVIAKTERITEPAYITTEIPCDSTYFEQKYKQGKVQYKIIREKGKVRVVFKKDSLNSFERYMYQKTLRAYDSLRVEKANTEKVVVVKDWKYYFWKWGFVVLLVLWAIGATPKFILESIMKKITAS